MRLRMRQLALAARYLKPVEQRLCGLFGLEPSLHDPNVAQWGLENTVIPIGNNFLEVVAPVENGTAAGRYLDRRGGDGGYMVIMQCDNLDHRRAHIDRLGVRVIADLDYGDYRGVQLHPADTGGAIMSLDWAEPAADPDDPAGPWHPAGADWQSARRTDEVTAMTAAELQSDDPAQLAARWSEVLQRPANRDARGNPEIALDDAVLRFVRATDGRGEGLGGIDLAVVDRAGLLQAAEAHGLLGGDEMVTICGTRFRLL